MGNITKVPSFMCERRFRKSGLSGSFPMTITILSSDIKPVKNDLRIWFRLFQDDYRVDVVKETVNIPWLGQNGNFFGKSFLNFSIIAYIFNLSSTGRRSQTK